MLKKIIFMMLCCLMLTACGTDDSNDIRPIYGGEFLGLVSPEVYDIDIEDKKVPEDFITRKMASDIKKVIEAHKSTNNSEDGSIDEETAVDIAMVIIKSSDKDYFEKPTSYCISYSLDIDAYFISISEIPENIDIIDDRQINLVISKKDGTLLAIWTS